MAPLTPMTPVRKLSLADAIYQQIRDSIISGELAPGSELPGERALAEQLEANRGAVREALKRLEQSRLVAIHQGGHTKVQDFRETGTLELVTHLLFRESGRIDFKVARSMIELRTVISPDLARLATLRGGPELAGKLRKILDRMRRAGDELDELRELGEDFWEALARGTDNVAYLLILNTVREVQSKNSTLLHGVLAEEYRDLSDFEGITKAIEEGDAEAAWRFGRQRAGKVSARLFKVGENLRESR